MENAADENENMVKREAFAVSLRKEKKIRKIAQSREAILKRLNLSNQSSLEGIKDNTIT